jgi:hypothetical protein
MSILRAFLAAALVLALASFGARAQRLPAVSTATKAFISYQDAVPVIEASRRSLPLELSEMDASELEAAWPGWVRQRDEAIRSRLERGDEDSVVHLWHYGTSFTKSPPLTERNVLANGGGDAAARILRQRVDDLLQAIAAPRGDERLQFARQVLERRGIDPTTPAGMAQARGHLEALRQRALAEYEEQRQTLTAAQQLDPVQALAAFATLFRDRGLSSDTSLLPSFAIDQALNDGRRQGLIRPGAVRRVAIVGPGLDFANKEGGYDFYPQQTIQPFGLIDSLARLGLANERESAAATFDLSPRVNHHLETSLARARAGSDYVVHLALPGDQQWNPELLEYWRRFGDRIGTEVEARTPPSSAGGVRVRAVRIPAARVPPIVPLDLNIVIERLQPLPAEERFDLVVATNILVYYDVFEQQLALANIAAMLRPGGLFLTNTPVPPVPPMTLSARYTTVSYSQGNTDHLFWYERQ